MCRRNFKLPGLAFVVLTGAVACGTEGGGSAAAAPTAAVAGGAATGAGGSAQTVDEPRLGSAGTEGDVSSGGSSTSPSPGGGGSSSAEGGASAGGGGASAGGGGAAADGGAGGEVSVGPRPVAEKPNIIIIFTDDQGYADVGVYGSGTAPAGNPWNDWDRIPIRTPHLDQMAAEGVRLTSFYAASPTCTRSRAGLLTGSYPKRVGFADRVLFPRDITGLNPNEITLADLLKARGYATAMFGKWHLGHLEKFLPTSNGFDEYFGVPYSNDMWADPRTPLADDATFREGWTREKMISTSFGEFSGMYRGDVPLMRGTETIEFPADQASLTKRCTDEAIRFVEEHKDEPFFIYLPHTMPHIPLFATEDFAGKSPRGLYGDVIEELDFNVGRLLDSLKEQGIDQNTLVVFTSDNGPWLRHRANGGSAYPLRDGKFSNWEGGMRVPGIFRWPGTIPADQVRDEPAIALDLYTTFAKLTGGDVPTGRVTDGEDIWPIIMGQAGASHGPIYYDLNAIRDGKWKLREGRLYDLEADIHEDQNVANANPAVVADLRTKLAEFNANVNNATRPRGQLNTEVLPTGCTDAAAANYDANAQLDDGSCGVP